MKTAIPITHARRNKLQQWDRTTGKCPSERFCLSVFHKASAWQLRKGEYNCSKCISFLAIKQVSHVHLGDGKRKGSAGRREKLWRIESCYFILNFIFHLCIFMSTSGGKLHFWEPRSNTSDAFLSPGCVILLAVRREMEDGRDRVKMEQRRGEAVMLYSPVTWSTRMREVIMRPYWEKSCSSSFWVIVFGRPLTYKFASLMEAELGRA